GANLVARAQARPDESALRTRGPQHVNVQDAVFLVGRARGAKPHRRIEALEPLLRRDAHGQAGIELGGSDEAEAHSLAAKALRTHRSDREHAPNRRLGALAARLDQSEISAQGACMIRSDPAQQMPGECVEAIGVLEVAALLDHEHGGACRQNGIDLARSELVELLPLPFHEWLDDGDGGDCLHWAPYINMRDWASPAYPMQKRYRIAVIPGDGIGKEVVPEGLRALEASGRRFGVELQ